VGVSGYDGGARPLYANKPRSAAADLKKKAYRGLDL
jgi:hypothetical protein